MVGQKQHLSDVQVLRALAALLVVISHTLFEIEGLWGAGQPIVDQFPFPGDIGVDIFFVISGFIMLYVSRNKFGDRSQVTAFWWRRILRVAPLYWFFTSTMVIALFLFPHAVNQSVGNVGDLISSYLFVPYARDGDGLFRPLLALGWTLNYEMFFYFLFGLCLLFPRQISIFCLISFLCALVVAGQLVAGLPEVVQFWSKPIILEFAFGLLLAKIFLAGFRISGLMAVVLTCCAGALMVIAPPFEELGDLRVVHYGLPALLLVGAVVLWKRDGAESEPPRALQMMGDASYSLYLSHPFALGLAALVATRFGLVDLVPSWAYFVLAVVICVAVGQVTYMLIERPFLAIFGRRKLREHDQKPSAQRLTSATSPRGTRKGFGLSKGRARAPAV